MADISASKVKELRERTQAGMSDCTRPIVRSRSKIQYAPTANMKKMPMITSNAVFVAETSGW